MSTEPDVTCTLPTTWTLVPAAAVDQGLDRLLGRDIPAAGDRAPGS